MPSSTDRTMRRTIVILGAVMMVIAGLLALWLMFSRPDPATVAGGTGTAAVGGPFELVDQAGTLRHSEDFAGTYLLVYFGYTFCPDVCPTSLTAMSGALDMLGEDGENVVPIFITIDPARDTVEQMASYAQHFHPRLVALTGTDDQVRAAAKAYRVYYKKAEDEATTDYLMDHTALVYFMGPDGAYLTHFNHQADAAEMADGMRQAMQID